jgi:hypothetical protein
VVLELSPSAVATPSGSPQWLFFGAAGLGVAALGTGSYFAVSAKSDSDAQRALDPLRRDAGAKEQIKRQSLVANLSFGVGALALAGAGVLFFTTNWPRQEPRQARFTPLAGPRMAGVLAEGEF